MTLLDQAYNQDEYLKFLSDKFQYSQTLAPIKIKDNAASSSEQIGFITTSDDKKLLVFEIRIKPNTKLARNRVQLRNLVAKQIQSEDGALAVYIDQDSRQWRFSYIAIEYALTEQGVERVQTASKRYTYLLGENAQTRTAQDRFSKLSKKSTLADLTAAFAVEPLSKEFYEKLYNWYDKTINQVTFPNDENAKDHTKISLIRMLTRLLFVWFLKEKDLINSDLFNQNELQSLIHYDRPSSFYKAILQNLFFATLNRKIVDRSFRTTTNGKANSTNYLATRIYRYQQLFQNTDQQNIIGLFEKTPFLNGGLFECLDREASDAEKQAYDTDTTIRPTASAIRMEGFSDKDSNQLSFPNLLFFNTEEQNLGLIDLFNQYQFTVEESTPADIEVALDPELLGKVFENLLASYNPETGGQARKATGSFYTPREIVNYMVDESLRQYFKQHPGLSDEEITVLFIEGENRSIDDKKIKIKIKAKTKAIITAIDTLKILDPAVGSGAFPMGILQRLVFILEKIDPENTHFKAQELSELPSLKSLEADIKTAHNISDEKAKNKALQELENRKTEINNKFAQQDHTYLQKLHLIENVIYGVDIQTIAIQICKLRFFISLAIEQQPNKDKNKDDNYGIEELPNLEAKFIVANSLLPLGKIETSKGMTETNCIFGIGIKELQKDLAQVRHKYFTVKTLTAKHKYRKQDQALRTQMLEDLKQSGITPEIEASMQKVVDWDLYNQNAVADWFDPEWMFGVKDGFDIVLGNPPYVGQKGNKNIFQKIAPTSLGVRFHQRRMDLFYFFFHLALDILKNGGHCAFITTNYFITATYADKLRQDIKDRATILKIVNFNELKIFESAAGQHNAISLLQKGVRINQMAETAITSKTGNANEIILRAVVDKCDPDTRYCRVKQADLYEGKQHYIRMGSNENPESTLVSAVLEKVAKCGKPLGELVRVSQGIVTGCDRVSRKHLAAYCLEAKKGDGIFIITKSELEQLAFSPNELQYIRPWFKNSDVKQYFCSQESNTRLIYRSSKHCDENIPNIKKHLKRFKEILVNRNVRSGDVTAEEYNNFVKGLCKIDYVMIASAMKRGDYYCISYARDEKMFNVPKIVSPQRSHSNTFGYNEIPWYASADVYYITNPSPAIELKYILALLNSKLYFIWLYFKGKRKGEMLELYQKPLSEIPVKIISAEEQKPFVRLVDKIIKAKAQNQDTTDLETEIDKMVYNLYDLTQDEINHIEK